MLQKLLSLIYFLLKKFCQQVLGAFIIENINIIEYIFILTLFHTEKINVYIYNNFKLYEKLNSIKLNMVK